jgi:iron complex outermembrane recepter protein
MKHRDAKPALAFEITAIRLAAALLFALPAAAAAQVVAAPVNTNTNAADSRVDAEKIVITGSRIRRTPGQEGPTAVETITRDELQRQGVSSLNEAMNNLSAGGATSANENNIATALGSAAVSLRSLSPNATLVLVNGRRVAYNGFSTVIGLTSQSFVDLNSIPLAAVDRIEILKDSASAVYGSDAIGGVINVILRRDYSGVELGATFGDTSAGGRETRASAAAGIGSLQADGYNLLAVVQASQRSAIMGRDRPYAVVSGALPRYASLSSPTGNPVGLSRPIDNTPRCPNATPVVNGGSTLCGENAVLLTSLSPKQRGADLYLRGTALLGTAVTGFAEAGYSRNENTFTLNPATRQFTVLASNPANPYGQNVVAPYRFDAIGPRIISADNVATRVLAGAKGDIGGSAGSGGHQWEVAIGQTRTDSTQEANNILLLAPLAGLVSSGTLKLFEPNTPAVLDSIRASAVREGRYDVQFVDARVGGDIGVVLGAEMAYAVGGEARREEQFDRPSPDLAAGKFVGFGLASGAFSVARKAGAMFGEVSARWGSQWEAVLALRAEHYSDFGKSVNPKLGLRFSPLPEVALRVSGGTSFRAPSLLEANYPPSSTAGSGTDTTRCAALNITLAACPSSQFTLNLKSDANIGPERARTFTAGAVFAISSEVSTSIDVIDIRLKDQIGLNFYEVFPTGGRPIDERFVTRGAPAPNDPAGVPAPLSTVTLEMANAYGETRTRSIDVGVQARTALAGGRLDVDAHLTYLALYEQKRARGEPLSTLTGSFGFPRLRGSLSTTYSSGPWAGTAVLRHIGSYRDDGVVQTVPRQVAVDSTLDVQAQYQFGQGTKLAVGARNVMDRDPPQAISLAQGYNTQLSSPRGRFVYGRVTHTF